eukprot:TRINITY_DN3076_c0_g1_i1.p3 TRINITY_DN3076_c0_g1~~TRINITY_DN3076_c0_g1_i1.p3  ORF type:complete len:245 (-),score=13.74 TRINITY_DN3076_c0_g1_i1:649-1359(-)
MTGVTFQQGESSHTLIDHGEQVEPKLRSSSHDHEPKLTRSKSQYSKDLRTLDEPILTTLWRDVSRIGHNLFVVLVPCYYGFRGKKGREQQLESLRNWDLWGPLIFTIILGVVLAKGADDGDMFAIVFGTIAVGGCLLNLNVLLLGGQIVFFQAMCLIGYCVFPLDIAAIVTFILKSQFGNKTLVIHIAVIFGCIFWSSWASVPFVQEATPPGRKMLAVYPLILMYIFIGYLIFTYI